MSTDPAKAPNAFAAFIGVAALGAAASVIIATVALNRFSTVTDGMMWAVAVMTTAPSVMAIGVSFFIARSDARRREP